MQNNHKQNDNFYEKINLKIIFNSTHPYILGLFFFQKKWFEIVCLKKRVVATKMNYFS